jgi:hypothetical protein
MERQVGEGELMHSVGFNVHLDKLFRACGFSIPGDILVHKGRITYVFPKLFILIYKIQILPMMAYLTNFLTPRCFQPKYDFFSFLFALSTHTHSYSHKPRNQEICILQNMNTKKQSPCTRNHLENCQKRNKQKKEIT